MTRVHGWRGHVAIALLLGAARPLSAQCPDGTPPPCRRPIPAGPRAAPIPIDSATALVVPLSPVGADTALRRLAATFAAVIAENMTVGEVRARVADNLAPLLVEQRLPAAARVKAGAVVDGTLIKIGANVRAAVRLVDARTAKQLTQATVEGSPDSLLALADRASLELLKAWWKHQPGPHFRDGLTTASLPALRRYIQAMAAWRQGRDEWADLLDSAVHHDPDFVAAWTWLAVPRLQSLTFWFPLSGGAEGFVLDIPVGPVSPDSARQVLARVVGALSPEAQREGLFIGFQMLSLFGPWALRPPRPGNRGTCPWGPLMWPTVEERYLYAVAASLATLVGCSDTTALRTAENAWSVDSMFTPAWTLLFGEKLAIGDTATARNLLRRFPGADTTQLARSRIALASRFAVPAKATFDDSGYAAIWSIPWHRSREVAQLAPFLRRFAASEMQGMPEVALRWYLEFPTYVTLGQMDSARAILQDVLRAVTADSTVGRAVLPPELVTALVFPWFPPDAAFTKTTSVSTWLEALARWLREWEGHRPTIGVPPQVVEQFHRAAIARLLRGAWYTGVRAVQHGEFDTALRSVAVLDSLSTLDSLQAAPLRLGLRGELALAADSGAVAESLLVEAIAASAPRPSPRYRWLLATRYAAGGHPDLALRLAHSITMPSRWRFGQDEVLGHLFYYASALKLEAEALERLGHLEEAIGKYQDFVDLRTDADSAFQGEVGDVHIRLARLAFVRRDYAAAWRHAHEAQQRDVSPPPEFVDALRRAMTEPAR